ncbi:MAG: HD domain-containing protein [Erysipelotrichaceae bacterium]|nr:HD domain-containing protein [Erysipelotrichaceae bacterium]
MDRERFAKQISFILEADQEKNIMRQTHLSNHGRNENDAEHAWHMALMAYLLKEYANEDIDISKVMIMCLIHDIVEIDAGDTYAYDAEGLKTQKEREEKAKERIFGLLPDDQKEMMTALFDEFEAFETPESCFAHAMDNFQPFLLNDSNEGGDWQEHGVSISQVLRRQTQSAKGSKEITDYVLEKLEEHVEKGHIKDDRK